MNYALNIIKARVEQDKYAAVELKIIKADNNKITKDLYVEKEIKDGEFYVVSDNVLVALHRTLRSGDTPNLEVISKNGDVVIGPKYSKIDYFDDGLFLCTKSVSTMISVENNQKDRKDSLKVQEIANTSKSIKEQMNEVMTKNNPNSDNLKFIFDDAYNEAIAYHIVKDGDKYKSVVVADNASFIAYDGINLYSHSNIVVGNTRVETIGTPTITEGSSPVISEVSIKPEEIKVDENLYEKFAPKKIEEDKKENENLYKKFAPKKKDDEEGQGEGETEEKNLFKKFAPKKISNKEEKDLYDKYAPKKIEKKYKDKELFEKYAPKKNEKKVKVPEMKDESLELASATFDNFFDIANSDAVKSEKKEEKKEIKEEAKKEKIDTSDDSVAPLDRLSVMINRLIEKDKNSTDMINVLNDQIDRLNDKLDEKEREIDSKDKKINDLINDNRRYIDENRSLKDTISSLEEENSRYMDENKKLKKEARDGRNKINAVISSIGEVLDSYDEKTLVKKAA